MEEIAKKNIESTKFWFKQKKTKIFLTDNNRHKKCIQINKKNAESPIAILKKIVNVFPTLSLQGFKMF